MRGRTPSPNRGASVQDILDIGEMAMTQVEFQQKYGIKAASQIRLQKIIFMRYQVPDLVQATTFLKDFGLFEAARDDSNVWFRGYGEEQYVYHLSKGPKKFLGGAFEVERRIDLERALHLPGVPVLSKGIEELTNAPGGGFIVTLEDPEGFPISLVHGQTPSQAKQYPEKIIINDEIDKPRQRRFQRFKHGPAPVFKLGHYGLVVKNFEAQFAFYTKNFNLMPTSILHLDDGTGQKTNVGMFAHIDCGERLVDHHTMFMVTLPPGHEKPHVHHCSFEIHDIDAQAMGHDWLVKKGYKSVWGLGRHVLGSQIFDYWWDPYDFMVEHYIDGDVVNSETPVSFHLAESAKDAAWGPEVPAPFLE